MNNLYMHFHPDEHHFVDRVLDWIHDAAAHHKMRRTDFLDPRQAYILTTLVQREGQVQLRLDGGYGQAERKRAWIAPEYIWLDDEDAGICVLAVTSDDSRIARLDHGDYMGAILGLGIKRDKTGDLHVHEQGCHYLVTEDIAEFIHLHLQQVHRVNVKTQILSLQELQVSSTVTEEIQLFVASMRLDGIASEVFRMSRAKVLQPIKAGRLRINWKVVEDPSHPLSEGDIVSMQGFGRFQVISVDGTTKSGRLRMKIAKYV